MIKGVIIDFNGTLYEDHDINRKAWEDAFDSVKTNGSKSKFSDLDRKNIHSDYLLSKAIYKFFNIEATDEMINKLSENKEIEYRQLAIKQKRDKLINGIEGFMDYLIKNHIPYCIASMAPTSNFDFYLDYLHLDRWFSYDNIVKNDGEYLNKNSQLLEAAERMNVDVRDCLIIEDTPENIIQAIDELKVDKIIYINTRNIEYISKAILQEIKDFTELEYKIFNN